MFKKLLQTILGHQQPTTYLITMNQHLGEEIILAESGTSLNVIDDILQQTNVEAKAMLTRLGCKPRQVMTMYRENSLVIEALIKLPDDHAAMDVLDQLIKQGPDRMTTSVLANGSVSC